MDCMRVHHTYKTHPRDNITALPSKQKKIEGFFRKQSEKSGVNILFENLAFHLRFNKK